MTEKPSYEDLERQVEQLKQIEFEFGQKQAALRESEQKYKKISDLMRLMCDNVPDMIWAKDLENRYIFANKAICRHLLNATDTREPIGKTDQFFAERERIRFPDNPEWHTFGEICQNSDQVVMAAGIPMQFDEFGNARGQFLFLDVHKAPLINESGKTIGTIGSGRDITENKLFEKELLYIKNIIDSSSCAIATCDLEGNMTYGNPSFQKLWGFSGLEDFLGKPFQDFWILDDNDENIMAALKSKGSWAGELKGVRKDGTLFDVQVSADTVLDETGDPVALTSTSIDITDRKVLETKLQKVQKAESLERMAGAIAHHFNNQLCVVTGNLELLLNGSSGDAGVRENLMRALMAAQRAAEVSRQMLIYLGQIPGTQEPVDLSRVCRQNLYLLQAVIPKGINLNVDCPDSGPVVHADEGKINQVLGHLITNAWESIPDNQGTIGLTIKTVSQADIPVSKRFPIDWQPQPVSYASIEVSDTGCGITGMDIDKLFDPFFTTKFTGRGMGLSVAIGTVKACRGCITVDSEPSRGSVFRIYLPISVQNNTLPAIQKKLVAMPSRKAENRGAVLLIEDEETVRAMAKAMLIHFGFAVIEAQDGVEAVEIFQQRQNEVCCVLSDLTMPRMNGWETLTALRRIRADVPVILASGHSKGVAMAGSHPELPQAFLSKPYSMAALKSVLMEICKHD